MAAKPTQGYSNSNQINIVKLELSFPDAPGKKYSIKPLMEEVVIYEDIFQSSLTGALTLVDQNNLVGERPIVGGETIDFSFMTTLYTTHVDLTFTVYKVGERYNDPNGGNAMMYDLYLCTPEMYWAVNNDISKSFKGTYKDIATALLKLYPNQKKTMDFDSSTGISTFVCPNWDIFRALKFSASRAFDGNQSPFLFYESTDGYHFKSVKTLYDVTPDKKVFLQPRTMHGFGGDINKFFNTALSFEYIEANDRLTEYKRSDFGTEYHEMNFKDKQFTKKVYKYGDTFAKIHLNQYPLTDDMSKQRNKSGFIFQHPDSSQNVFYQRRSIIDLMDNTIIRVAIPGDSNLHAGNVLNMDVPSKVGPTIKNEDIVSGKWLVSSLKHVIKRNTYTQTLELTTDSWSKQVRGGLS